MQEVIIGEDRVSVGDLIGKGGEGEVYSVKGRSGLAVKIYDADKRAERADKVRAMVCAGLAVKTDLVVYPREVVSDGHGNFLGFVMRLVSGYQPLHELYSPKSRQRQFPKADYRFVVHTAINVARAVGKVHQTGCVIGDLNHSGVLVGNDATVALIDADSFQFCLNGKSYPCVVGVPEFTPPELHGKHLGAVERTIDHDNFGLAVAIFHLLFMGRHPYAGRYDGPDISLGEAIAQNRFAFSLARQAATRSTPPPGVPTLDLYPGIIGSAFENAFGPNFTARPGALDWIGALTGLQGSLNRCTKFKTHYYPSDAGSCVWCKLAIISGFDMFPDLSVVMPSILTDTRGTEQAIREILAFRMPTAADLLPQAPDVAPGASSALREAKNAKRGRMLLGLLMIATAIAGFIFSISVWFICIALGFWGWSLVRNREVEVGPFRRAFINADQQVQRELNSFVRRSGLTEVMKVHGDLGAAISSYKAHDDNLARELSKLKSTREKRQRAAYLDQFPIRRANISGIGPAKTATLISFGIETAADVNRPAVLLVPGFGAVLGGKLMDWRRMLEVHFKYDPMPNAQDIADERALRARFVSEKAKLEATIRNGLGTLRNAKVRLEVLPARAHGDRSLLQALESRARAAQDLKLLGEPIPNSYVTLSIAPPSQSAQQSRRSPTVSTRRPRAAATAGVPNCPQCGSHMRRRSGRYGNFWGCSRYPYCKGRRKI